MYSVVLLMAMTSGGESIEARGCRGCSCSCRAARGCRGSRGCRRHGCHGCYSGGCYGGGGYCHGGYGGGCYGGGYGGHGCHGGYAMAGHGCYGGHMVSGGHHGHHGGYVMGGQVIGGYGVALGAGVQYGTVIGGGTIISGGTDVATAEEDNLKPGTALSATEQTQLKEMLDAEKDPAEKKKIEDEFKKDSRVGRKATYEVFKKMKTNRDEVSTTATIIVAVPIAAKVTIDGAPTAATSNVRYFESPTLAKGHTYSYTFEAEYQKDGKAVKVQKQVSFQAGQAVRCDLTNGATAVASK
jgi:uncharacterized protein (TIGR03000 family)